MSNMNIYVEDFQTRLINLHNELGSAVRTYESEAKGDGYTELHSALDRYGLEDLKEHMKFKSEDVVTEE